jgi:hypothetical protein
MAKRTETAWCYKCRKVTTWKGGPRRVYCEGCGTDFPCAHACSHWDCGEERATAVSTREPPAVPPLNEERVRGEGDE